MKKSRPQDVFLRDLARQVAQRCPRLVAACYWSGTSCICVEELHHRTSLDLDFHTRRGLADVRPLLAEMTAAFPDAFTPFQGPDEARAGFAGALTLSRRKPVTIEVFSNFEDVPASDLQPSSIPNLWRITLRRYLANKIQCVADRNEARDLVDIGAVLRHRPDLAPHARRTLAEQDASIVEERLNALTAENAAADLLPYDDVTAAEALKIRDLLLNWLRGPC